MFHSFNTKDNDRCCMGVSPVVCASVDVCAVQVLKRCSLSAEEVHGRSCALAKAMLSWRQLKSELSWS